MTDATRAATAGARVTPIGQGASARKDAEEAILLVENISVTYRPRRGFGWGAEPVHSVKDVTLRVARGSTVALIGASGSGKTTLARAIVRLIEAEGHGIFFSGTNLLPLSGRALLPFRHRIQLVFQDCQGALDPRMRVADLVGEGLFARGVRDKKLRREHSEALLASVRLDPSVADRYAHELSGGQRQRVALARALSVEPELLVLDEAFSGIDAVHQANLIDLLLDLQASRGISYLVLGHDLAMVSQVADRVAVMHQGRIVEDASAEALFESPVHPHTKALLAAIPSCDPAVRRLGLSLEAGREPRGGS